MVNIYHAYLISEIVCLRMRLYVYPSSVCTYMPRIIALSDVCFKARMDDFRGSHMWPHPGSS